MQARQTMEGLPFPFYFIFYLNATVPAGETPDLYKNQLHFGYGINYKYNGKLYHNLERVWVVHRVVIPQTQDLTRLPDFPDRVNCIPHVKDKEMDLPHMERNVWAQTLCKAAAPHLKMLQKQASYLKRRGTKIVKDDLCRGITRIHRLPSRPRPSIRPTAAFINIHEHLI